MRCQAPTPSCHYRKRADLHSPFGRHPQTVADLSCRNSSSIFFSVPYLSRFPAFQIAITAFPVEGGGATVLTTAGRAAYPLHHRRRRPSSSASSDSWRQEWVKSQNATLRS